MQNTDEVLLDQRKPPLGEQKTRLLWKASCRLMPIQRIGCILCSFRSVSLYDIVNDSVLIIHRNLRKST